MVPHLVFFPRCNLVSVCVWWDCYCLRCKASTIPLPRRHMNRSLTVSVWLSENTRGPSRCHKSYLLTMCSSMEPWKELTLAGLHAITEATHASDCGALIVACKRWWIVCLCLPVYVFWRCAWMCVCLCVLTFADEPSTLKLLSVSSMIWSPLYCFSCLHFGQLRAFSAFHHGRFVSRTFAHLRRKVYTVWQSPPHPPIT